MRLLRRGCLATLIAMLLVVACPGAATAADEAAAGLPPVIIEFFFEPGCPECEQVKQEVLPELEARYDGFYVLRRYDVGVISNVARLVTYQDELGVTENEPVSMFVDYQYVFSGVDAMKQGLYDRVDESVGERLAPGWTPPAPIEVAIDDAGGTEVVVEHMRNFALLAVIAGGLTDGINPCAISTLVFFMSLLAVARVKGRALLMMGVSFCLASFLTYTALGFGLLRVLHTFAGFPVLRTAVDTVLIASLAVLSLLSIRDAWRYHRSGEAGDVTLQLPDRIKRRIHEVMRTRLKTGNLVVAGFVIGTAVTALESICTGQVYVPTLVVVVKSGRGSAQALLYLLLYNAMFVTPLVIVFALTFCGLRTQTLLNWSRTNVVASKVLLGLFFAAMAALILLI